MTYEKFIELIYSLKIKTEIPKFDIVNAFGVYWGMGGKTSEGDPDLPDPEPIIEDLILILENTSPNIKCLQYQKLYNKCVQTKSCSRSGYYSTCDFYGIKYVYIDDLYYYLRDNKLFEIFQNP